MLHKELYSKIVEHYERPDVVNRSVFFNYFSGPVTEGGERGTPYRGCTGVWPLEEARHLTGRQV